MSTQNYKEILASTHPIFRVPATKVFWFDSVTSKDAHQGNRQRFCAITSPGIFLFERKTLSKGYFVSRIISYSDLLLICADSDSMQFFKPKVTMNLQNSHHLEAFAIVLAIRNALFGDKPREPKVMIDPSVQEQVEKNRFNFESENLLSDRFLSLCLNIDEKNLNPEQISDIYDCLKISPNFAQISPEIVNSPLITAVSLAIAYDNDIQSLHLKNVNFSTFVPNFVPIVQYNYSIQKLYLSSVTFSGKLQSYVDVFKDKTSFSANQFIFNDCSLNTSDFVTFFKTFKKFPADMQSISFIHCNISTLALETIFSTISSSLCFRTLSELLFMHMKTDTSLQTCFLQFVTSNFFMVQKNLLMLSLEDVQIDVDVILPFLLHAPSYFSRLSLIGNNFMKPISIADFHMVTDIDLSFIRFTSDSLISILGAMSAAKNHPRRITLDSLSIADDEWEKFYREIGKVVISDLTMISFSGNKMKADWMHLFKKFLLNHPSLTELGISNSILYTDAEESIKDLIEFVNKSDIRKLEIIGKGETILREKLVPLLVALFAKKSIKMLDITGQEIADQGLEIISKKIEETKTDKNNALTIEELRFDGNTPSSVDAFVKFVTDVGQSQILASEWPESDARFVVAKAEVNLRQTILKQIERLKKQFCRRFALEDENLAISQKLTKNQQTASSQKNPQETTQSFPKKPISNSRKLSFSSPTFLDNSKRILNKKLKEETCLSRSPVIDLNILSFREDYVDRALAECLGIDLNEIEKWTEEEIQSKEPLVIELNRLNNDTSIEAFLKKDQ